MIAKGKIYVSKEKMAELLCLPEDVEILAVKAKELEDGFEFLVVSAEETVITKKGAIGQMRRISVDTLERLRDNGKKVNVTVNVSNQKETDVKAILDEITKNIRTKGIK